MTKLDTLALEEGYDDYMEMLEELITESVVPGICKNPDCNYTTSVEPDSDSGWCENCEANTVVSCMVLAGVM